MTTELAVKRIEDYYGLPLAASAWIVDASTGLVLAVSRKNDETDLGLPGGKLDPGEDFRDAVKRETKEETNLDVVDLFPIYGAACGTPGIHHVHWCLTYICKVTGTVKRMEKGKVVWVPPERLITKATGEYNSFGLYNHEVQKAVQAYGSTVREYYSTITINPEFQL